jgi:hypothetical protein
MTSTLVALIAIAVLVVIVLVKGALIVPSSLSAWESSIAPSMRASIF